MRKCWTRLFVLLICLVPTMAYAQDHTSSDMPKVMDLTQDGSQTSDDGQANDAQNTSGSEPHAVSDTQPVPGFDDHTRQTDTAENMTADTHPADMHADTENPEIQKHPKDNWTWTGDEAIVNNESHTEDEVWVWADRVRGEESDLAQKESVLRGHGLQLTMSLVGIPGYVFDAWFDQHGNMWDGVANMGFSLDYTMRFTFPMELRLSLSWTSLRTGSAFWLETSNTGRPELASYVINTLSTVALEAAVYHMIPITDAIAFYYGGGLWGGVVLGSLESRAIHPDCADQPFFDPGEICGHAPSGNNVQGLPPVIGSLIVTLGFKFVLLEHMTIRAEGGFKGYFYGQVGLGVEF